MAVVVETVSAAFKALLLSQSVPWWTEPVTLNPGRTHR